MQKAKEWTKRIWDWIDSVSTAAWLFAIFGGGAVLGALYSFIGGYRDLPLIGQVFFDIAIFAAAGLVAMLGVRTFFPRARDDPPHPELQTEPQLPVPQVHLAPPPDTVQNDRTREAMEHLRVLWHGYALPAFDAEVAILGRFISELHRCGGAFSSVALLVERTMSEPASGKRAEVLRMLDEGGTDDQSAQNVQDAFGEFYYMYQAVTTWVHRCADADHLAVELQSDEAYRIWQQCDREFLTRLRETIGRSGLERVRQRVNGTGWGEQFRYRLGTVRGDDR